MKKLLAMLVAMLLVLTAMPMAMAEEPVTLTWYLPCWNTATITDEGYNRVIDKINSITVPALNVKVELKLNEDLDTRAQMVIASGEPFDLMYTCNWLNPYVSNVSKGAYAPLEDLLPVYAPELLEVTPEYAWDAVTVNGHIYAMHCRQNWNRSEGIYIRGDLAEKYGFAPEGIVTIEELEELYAAMREGEPADFYPTYVDANYRWPYYLITYNFEEVTGRNIPGCYILGGEGYELVNQFETETFREYCHMMRRWNENGYIRPDSATYSLTSDNYDNDLLAGKLGSCQQGFCAPHVAASAESAWGNIAPAVTAQTTEGWAENSIITSSLTAVGINSQHKEKAVALYNLVVANPELYNTILYGVEGINYEKVSENQVRLIPGTGYGSGTGEVVPSWACGHQFNSWVLETQRADIWDLVKASSDAGQPSAILGFVFDPSNVQTEIANCSAVVSEHLRLLDTGSFEDVDAALDAFIEALKTAGSEEIVDEAQAQLDAWLAAK